LDQYDNIDLYEGEVEEILPGLDFAPDLVLVDPPRSGLDKEARLGLLNMNCPEIIYISCDPATLARDLKYFIEAGYELSEILAFDLFPQTYHIESISHLVRRQEFHE
jgi:23S rRNA (uracil1939-C5)-methyltransferase